MRPSSTALPSLATAAFILLLLPAVLRSQPGPWQANQPLAHLDIDGIPGFTSPSPAIVIKDVGDPGILTVSSTSFGSPFDICFTPSPVVPSVIVTPFNQVLNLNLNQPGTLCLTNGFQSTMLPGVRRLPFAAPGPLVISVQMAVLTPAHPDGFALSAAVELRIEPFCAQPPIIESFADIANLDVVTGPVVWDGSGQLNTTYPTDLLGDGSDGAVVFTQAGSPHVIDVNTIPLGSPGHHGVWNAQSILVEPGAQVRFKGDWPIRFQCQGPVTFGPGSLVRGNAALPDSGVEGPWKGGLNNNSPTPGGAGNHIVLGGSPGPGGGRGGDASQAGNPVRTLQADLGHGPSVDGLPGSVSSDPGYGPGQGGEGAQQVQQVIGAGGGAGGSAYARGGDGIPLTGINSSGLCGAPLASPQVAPSASFGFPSGFVPPVVHESGGSGGGGGGDRFDLVTATINLDDQGGGGGGAGGGFRVSCGGDIHVQTGARIEMNGSPGNSCVSLGSGAGGSGSGGMIWMQSFSSILIDPNANMQVHGGGCPTGPLGLFNYRCAAAPGIGGEGLYQFEDSDGLVNINFQGSAPLSTPGCGTSQTGPQGALSTGDNIAVLPFPLAGTTQGTARSRWIDTGFPTPKYVQPGPLDEQFTLGNAPGASIVIEYQGDITCCSGSGASGTAAGQTPWVTGANIQALDGHQLIRFRVTISYDAPPMTYSQHVLPSVQEIRINLETSQNCP